MITDAGFEILLEWCKVLAEASGMYFVQATAEIIGLACEVYEYCSEKYSKRFDDYIQKYIKRLKNNRMVAIVMSASYYKYKYNGRYYAWSRYNTILAY